MADLHPIHIDSLLLGLVAKDYQYVLDGSLALIATVNQTLAHKTRHSQQFNKNSRNDREFFSQELCRVRDRFPKNPALNAQRNI
jgi:hypothetical protein